jgi:hypothetical protein
MELLKEAFENQFKNQFMKKIIVFTLLLIMSETSFSQPATIPALAVKTDYLKKSKSQKTGAWLLLGGGIAVSGITALSSFRIDFVNKKSFPVVPVCIGGAMMAGSIPLFIAAQRNKKKSLSLSFKNETAPQIQQNSFVYKLIPSLSVKISL